MAHAWVVVDVCPDSFKVIHSGCSLRPVGRISGSTLDMSLRHNFQGLQVYQSRAMTNLRSHRRLCSSQ
jgi:hypothetical protein